MYVGIANPRWWGKRSRIPCTCATRNFLYLARGPWPHSAHFVLYFTYQIWTKYPSISKCISFNGFCISLNFGEFHWICSKGPTVHEISICSNIIWNLIVTTTFLHITHTSIRARYRMSCWARSCNKASYRILKLGHGRVINETTPYCNSLVVLYTYYFLSVVGAKSVIQQSYQMVWVRV